MHGKRSFVKAGLILTVIVLAFVFTRPAAGTKKNGTIHFYTIYGWGAYADSQYLQTFKSSMSAVVKDLGMKGVFNHYEEDKDFFKAISAPGDNIIQAGNREQLVIAITKYGYRPFIAYSFLGLKKNKCCLYVRKDSRFKSAGDLEGGSLTMSKNLIEYLSLRKLIGAGLRGMTSNPTIFNQAISSTTDYDDQIIALHEKGKSIFEIYDDLTIRDVQQAADFFKPVYEKTKGRHGFVSTELPTAIVMAKEGSFESRVQAIVQAGIKRFERTQEAIANINNGNKTRNILLKIPATELGLKAGEELEALGYISNSYAGGK